MTSKQEFLSELPIFTNLTDEELSGLSRVTKAYAFEPGAVIAFQRDVADAMVIVKDGRLYAKTVDKQGITRDARSYTRGECFGEAWLFVTGIHPATVTGAEAGRILVIEHEDFLRFLEQYPEALRNMQPVYDYEDEPIAGLPEEIWEQAQKLSVRDERQRFGDIELLPNELIEFAARRSQLYLVAQLLLPVLLLIGLPVAAYAFDLSGAFGELDWFMYICLGAPMFMLGLIILIILLDWRNDYFVMTDKHISRRDFSLRTFRIEYTKVPIEQVQNVTVVRPSLLANLLNIGTTEIRTAAQAGTVLFDNIDDPYEVIEVFKRVRGREEAYDAALAQTNMRAAINQRFEINPGVAPVTAEDGEDAGETAVLPPAEPAQGWLERLITWRLVDGDTITYRKNRWVLVGDILPPLFGFFFLTTGVILGTIYFPSQAGLIVGISLPFYLANFVWLIWQYEDWRNDTFQLTNQFVIDIDRKPFGFSEDRKQAPLSNIQNISALKPNFLATVFNFGNVIIETAGAQADITFESVPRPNQVLREIFQRVDTVRQTQRRREGAARRDEYAVLLDVYKQELEQNRIPRRTPPLDGGAE